MLMLDVIALPHGKMKNREAAKKRREDKWGRFLIQRLIGP